MKHILSIAGSDSSCGAGIQADLKTFLAHGVYGLNVITSITAQNTSGVMEALDVEPKMIKAQLKALFEDIKIDVIKIGMISSRETIQEIVKILEKYPNIPVVLDTIMISSSGFELLQKEAKEVFIKKLIPKATLITPNIPEAIVLSKQNIENIDDMKNALIVMYDSFHCKNILLKGGHLKDDAIDMLYDGKKFIMYKKEKIISNNTHGTGCALSSSIASNLALGDDLEMSIQKAKKYVRKAIKYGFSIGSGIGQLNHFYKYKGYINE